MALPFGINGRQVVRYAGFILVGLVTFVFALQLTFPYGRIKDKIIEGLADKYDVTIGGVERGWWPGKVTFTAVSMRSRPTKADDQVTTIFVERLTVSPSILAELRGQHSVDFDAVIGAGTLKGNVAINTSGIHVDFDGHALPGGSLPLRDQLGLPIIGKLEIAADLDLPIDRNRPGHSSIDWTKADGSFDFGCPSGCSIGDGKTKLKPKIKNARNAAFAADGIDFGIVNIDMLSTRVELKDGKLEVAKWETKSPDGEIHVDLAITLAPEINDSMVTGCLRFKGSDALLKREPKTYAAIQTTGAPLAPDGLFDIRLDGKLRDVRRLGQLCGPGAPTESEKPELGRNGPGSFTGGNNHRPNLTVQPEPPTVTVEPRTLSTPPVQQQPTPPPSAPTDEHHELPLGASMKVQQGSASTTITGSGSAADPAAGSDTGSAAAGSADPNAGSAQPGDIRPM